MFTSISWAIFMSNSVNITEPLLVTRKTWRNERSRYSVQGTLTVTSFMITGTLISAVQPALPICHILPILVWMDLQCVLSPDTKATNTFAIGLIQLSKALIGLRPNFDQSQNLVNMFLIAHVSVDKAHENLGSDCLVLWTVQVHKRSLVRRSTHLGTVGWGVCDTAVVAKTPPIRLVETLEREKFLH